MKPSVTLGRPFGITVGAHWSLLVFGLLAMWTLATGFEGALPGYGSGTYWVTAAFVVILFVGGLIVHELAHALVARRHGIEVEGITLWILGGVAKLSSEPTNPKAELLISGAGPLASVAVSVVLFFGAVLANLLTDAQVLISGLAWLAVANLILAVFNLLPARPMDGGRILTGLLWWRTGDQQRATLAAAKASTVVGWGLAGLGGYVLFATGAVSGIWLALIGWMVLQSAGVERRLLEWRANLRGLTFRQIMTTPPPEVPAWTTVRELVERARGVTVPFHVVTDGLGVARGVITLVDAARMAMVRPDLIVGELARPLPEGAIAGPDEEVASVLGVRVVQLPVLVRDSEGHIVGQVGPAELSRWSSEPHPPAPPRVPTATGPTPVGAGQPWGPPDPASRAG